MRILISGAGVAGLSTAITLRDTGHDVTIVERAHHLRANGSPIDVRGEAIGVADRMGVLGSIRERRIDMSERVQFIDSDGVVVAEPSWDAINDSPDDIEIPREDLTNILYGHLGPAVDLRFGESVADLRDDNAGVDVRFASGATGRYDLVVGADGMHSAIRRLTFGEERQFLHFLGLYVALARFPGYIPTDRVNPIYNFPGHMCGIAAYNDQALAVFTFRSPWIDYDYHDLGVQKRILADAYAGHDEWRIPELVRAAIEDPELYFDSVSQIRMDSWHRGRVVLVGDAAHCTSNLTGRGTSLALTGAWILAEALRAHGDIDEAFTQYERDQRPRAVDTQAMAAPGAEIFAPATQDQIDSRNELLVAAARQRQSSGHATG
ncbi:FAD-dependent monooxygenase [Mycobacterium koreense]|uniref:Monooxygenase n=1 Tax=Mycolicibacillus koreensis TaxID=1069220 RepID=A0A7I7SHT0_9MYCO|nr:FAD-dependent monooxygenase [Mycolicibacillus koreensis]MCV7248537.1 FAD-dependent monooxygenase [Mycolicibacillus koreensis]ODR11797.1 monooxygenase [Mycolicibacillus koreensis]OSC32710.1 monooxygenase [Mycolicibacillus koreensis]BBY55496.1 FAD-dependent oxidoreductase [Mycolicibacillus koreensis]